MVTHGQPSADAVPRAFTVVVWNVHKQAEAYEDELPGLTTPDLVLLQEDIGPNVGAPLAERGKAQHVVSFRYVRGGAMTGVTTWTRAEVLTSVPLRTEAREPIVGTPKSALVSLLPFEGGGRLLAVNLHGINVRGARLLERQLVAIEAVVRDHDGPLLVAGDFNTWSRRRRAVVEGFAGRLGLRAVFEGEDAPRLDAVFVRALEVLEARVVDTKSSDHDALVVRLRARPRPPRF